MQKRSIAAFFIISSALLFSEPLHVAVLELAANGVSSVEAKAVTTLLQSEFAGNKMFRVIERGNVDAILKEQELSLTGCTESGCAVKIGKMLNVRAMIFGSVSKLGEMHFIAVNVIDVESSAVIGTAKAKIAKLDDADDAVREIVASIAEGKSTTTKSGIRIDVAIPDVGSIVSNALSQANKAQTAAVKTVPAGSMMAMTNRSSMMETSVKPPAKLAPHPGYAVWPVDFALAYPLAISGLERRGTIVFFSAGVINTYSYRLYGLKASGIVGITEEDAVGLMASGIGNVIKESASGISAAAIFNAAGSGFFLMQAGLVNVCQDGTFVFQGGLVNSSRTMRGVQAGLVNVASGTLIGAQIGLVNVAGRFGGIQIGLVNVSREGGLPFMPIVNIGIAF